MTLTLNAHSPAFLRTALRVLMAFVIGIILLLGVLLDSYLVKAATPDTSNLVKAELIAEPDAITPGEPFWVGVRMRMKEHWHTYWRNPGDSGEATRVDWSLPQGFSAGEIVWPTPNVLRVGPLANFGYENETILLVQITPPKALPASTPVDLKGRLSYLVCEKQCIPGEASLNLTLPVAGPGTKPGGYNATFDAARAALPQASPWPAQFSATRDAVKIDVAAPGLKADAIRSATFFPYADTLIENAAPQALTVTPEGLSLALSRSTSSLSLPDKVEGVLVIEEALGSNTSRQAFTLAATPDPAAPPAEAAAKSPAPQATGPVSLAQMPAAQVPAASPQISLWQAALFALLGGIILNLMPCVFPILSIKILHLTKYAGETPARVRLHGFAYTGGVVACFLALASVLFALRASGAYAGWGYQLQSPLVVALIAYVIFAMGLSLSGVVHFGGALSGAGDGLARRGGLQGSFFAGLLAAIVATPCTAPFMGTAVGFALTQPVATGLTVFLALAIGLALPFLILSLTPNLQRLLPKPGAWMETLKQLMAFPLYATVVWLIWVLSQQVGSSGLLAALSGLVLVAFAAWALNAANSSAASGSARLWRGRVATGFAVLALIGLVPLTRVIANDQPAAGTAAQTASPAQLAAGEGEPFSRERLEALLAAGDRPVFVNLTASWCITCLVNERTALSREAVRDAFQDKNIAYLKGDWTNQNPEITKILEQHGRSGVPLYLLYARGSKEPIVLPQILTEASLLEETSRL